MWHTEYLGSRKVSHGCSDIISPQSSWQKPYDLGIPWRGTVGRCGTHGNTRFICAGEQKNKQAGNIWTLCFQLCLSRSFWSFMKSKHRWQTFCPSLLVWISALDSEVSVRLAHFGCWIVQSCSWKFLVTFLQGSPPGVSSKEKSEYAAYSSQSGRKSCRAQKYRNNMK